MKPVHARVGCHVGTLEGHSSSAWCLAQSRWPWSVLQRHSRSSVTAVSMSLRCSIPTTSVCIGPTCERRQNALQTLPDGSYSRTGGRSKIRATSGRGEVQQIAELTARLKPCQSVRRTESRQHCTSGGAFLLPSSTYVNERRTPPRK